MLRSTLTIERHTYELDPDCDLATLKADIEQSARQGAGFVHAKMADRTSVSILVTPGVSIIIHTEQIAFSSNVTSIGYPQVSEWDLLDLLG